MRDYFRRIAIAASYDLQWSAVWRHLGSCAEGLKEASMGLLTAAVLPFYLILYWPLAPIRWAIAAKRHGKRIDIIGFRPRGIKANPSHYK